MQPGVLVYAKTRNHDKLKVIWWRSLLEVTEVAVKGKCIMKLNVFILFKDIAIIRESAGKQHII